MRLQEASEHTAFMCFVDEKRCRVEEVMGMLRYRECLGQQFSVQVRPWVWDTAVPLSVHFNNTEGLVFHRYWLPLWLRWKRICLKCRRPGFGPWVRKFPWRRKWQPTPVFLPGEFYGQRSPAGYSSWSRKESDTTEQLTLSLSSDCFPFSPRCTARLNFASSFTLQYSYLVNSCQRNVDGITSQYWDVYVIWALHNWGIWGNLGNLIGHSHSHFLLCVNFHTETAFSSNSGWKPSFKKTRHYQWYQHHTGVRCSSFYPLFLIAK